MNTRYVVALVLVIVVIVASMAVLHALVRPKQSVFTVGNNIVVPPIVPSGIPIFVVGSRSFVTNITVLYPSAMPIPISSLPSVGSGSVVFVYWDYVLGKLNGNVTLAYQYLKPLMRRQVFMVFMARNSTEALKLEILIANAWALANGVKPVAIPIIPYHKSLDYVVIAPMGHVIIIAQTNKEGTLQRLAVWLGMVENEVTWVNDECLTTAQQLRSNNQSFNHNYYLFWLGPQNAGNNYGTFVIDYCFEMDSNLAGTMNGVPWTPAWAYNYLGYTPYSALVNNGGYIVNMQTYQDVYSSYECYATNGNYKPPDAFSCGPSPYGYLTIEGYSPDSQLVSTLIIRPQAIIGAATPLGIPAFNLTWTFAPNEQVGTGQEPNYFSTSTVTPMAVPQGISTPQSIILPVGSSAFIYDGVITPLYTTCEIWGSRIYWLIFWPYPPYWEDYYQVIYAYPTNAGVPSGATFYDGGTIYHISWSDFLSNCTG